MNKLILILMVGSLFMGCASVTPSMLRPPENPIPNKIKSLIIGLEGENVIRNESLKTLTVQTDFATIFSRTIEQNICETNREKWGYVDAKMVFKKVFIKMDLISSHKK